MGSCSRRYRAGASFRVARGRTRDPTRGAVRRLAAFILLLVGLALEGALLEVLDDGATVSFRLTAVLAEAGVERTEDRAGTLTLRSDGHGWRVAYGELAELGLALFP